jgi:signal transduction histidine kinase
LIDDVTGGMDVLAQAKGLELTGHVESDVPARLSGDRQRLRQILINLVGNAIKFTDEGMVRTRAYRPDAAYWALEVSDTGCGIPPEAQGYIFDPFRQVEDPTTRKRTGAGLGLSITKQLVTLMGGEITLASEVGRGSAFTVVLPLAPIRGELP